MWFSEACSLDLSSAPSKAWVSAEASRRLRPRRVMMLSITAWMRREAPAGPAVPSFAVTVGSMPLKPLEAAASWPSAVVARAMAVAASSACWACPPSPIGAYMAGIGVVSSRGAAGPRAAGYSIGGRDGAWGANDVVGASIGCCGAAACRSATADRAASISLRISSCISGVCAGGGPAAAADRAAASPGRSELNGTTTTWRTTFSVFPWPDMSGSLTTGIMLSEPAGTYRDLAGSNRSWLTWTP